MRGYRVPALIARRGLLACALALLAVPALAQAWRPGQPPGFRPGFQFLGAAAPVTFADAFDRADENLEASPNWTRVGGATGTLAVRSNQVAAIATTQTAFLSPDLGAVNHYVEMTMTSSGAAGPLLAVRAVDSNNFVGVRQNSTNYQVYKVVANAFTLIGTTAQAPAVGDRLRFEARDGAVSLSINGAASLTNLSLGADLATPTRTGLVARSAVRNPWGDNYLAGAL